MTLIKDLMDKELMFYPNGLPVADKDKPQLVLYQLCASGKAENECDYLCDDFCTPVTVSPQIQYSVKYAASDQQTSYITDITYVCPVNYGTNASSFPETWCISKYIGPSVSTLKALDQEVMIKSLQEETVSVSLEQLCPVGCMHLSRETEGQIDQSSTILEHHVPYFANLASEGVEASGYLSACAASKLQEDCEKLCTTKCILRSFPGKKITTYVKQTAPSISYSPFDIDIENIYFCPSGKQKYPATKTICTARTDQVIKLNFSCPGEVECTTVDLGMAPAAGDDFQFKQLKETYKNSSFTQAKMCAAFSEKDICDATCEVSCNKQEVLILAEKNTGETASNGGGSLYVCPSGRTIPPKTICTSFVGGRNISFQCPEKASCGLIFGRDFQLIDWEKQTDNYKKQAEKCSFKSLWNCWEYSSMTQRLLKAIKEFDKGFFDPNLIYDGSRKYTVCAAGLREECRERCTSGCVQTTDGVIRELVWEVSTVDDAAQLGVASKEMIHSEELFVCGVQNARRPPGTYRETACRRWLKGGLEPPDGAGAGAEEIMFCSGEVPCVQLDTEQFSECAVDASNQLVCTSQSAGKYAASAYMRGNYDAITAYGDSVINVCGIGAAEELELLCSAPFEAVSRGVYWQHGSLTGVFMDQCKQGAQKNKNIPCKSWGNKVDAYGNEQVKAVTMYCSKLCGCNQLQSYEELHQFQTEGWAQMLLAQYAGFSQVQIQHCPVASSVEACGKFLLNDTVMACQNYSKNTLGDSQLGVIHWDGYIEADGMKIQMPVQSIAYPPMLAMAQDVKNNPSNGQNKVVYDKAPCYYANEPANYKIEFECPSAPKEAISTPQNQFGCTFVVVDQINSEESQSQTINSVLLGNPAPLMTACAAGYTKEQCDKFCKVDCVQGNVSGSLEFHYYIGKNEPYEEVKDESKNISMPTYFCPKDQIRLRPDENNHFDAQSIKGFHKCQTRTILNNQLIALEIGCDAECSFMEEFGYQAYFPNNEISSFYLSNGTVNLTKFNHCAVGLSASECSKFCQGGKDCVLQNVTLSYLQMRYLRNLTDGLLDKNSSYEVMVELESSETNKTGWSCDNTNDKNACAKFEEQHPMVINIQPKFQCPGLGHNSSYDKPVDVEPEPKPDFGDYIMCETGVKVHNNAGVFSVSCPRDVGCAYLQNASLIKTSASSSVGANITAAFLNDPAVTLIDHVNYCAVGSSSDCGNYCLKKCQKADPGNISQFYNVSVTEQTNQWKLPEYRCPKGFEKRLFKALETWKTILIALCICLLVAIIVCGLIIHWQKRHRYDDDNDADKGVGNAIRQVIY